MSPILHISYGPSYRLDGNGYSPLRSERQRLDGRRQIAPSATFQYFFHNFDFNNL